MERPTQVRPSAARHARAEAAKAPLDTAPRHAAAAPLAQRLDPLGPVADRTHLGHRALVLVTCLATATAITGAALTVGQRPAAASPPQPVAAKKAPAVHATGSGPVVETTVTGVKAPYALPTGSDPNAPRTELITVAQANAGTKWKTDAVIPGHCATAGKEGRAGLTPGAEEVLDCIAAAFPELATYYGVGHRASNSASDHPNGRAVDAMIDDYRTPEGRARGWQVAHYVQANAEALNVKYIIWDSQIWTGSGWRAYRHPSGGTDDNLLHKNHVHVSVRS